MRFLIFALLLSLSLSAQDNSNKVVFDFTNGDTKAFEKKILSGIAFQKGYYESKLEDLEVAVVIHGDAYKFFLKDLSQSKYKNDKDLKEKQIDFAKRIKSLSSMYDVEFLICNSGIKRLKIDKENIYDFVKLVPTSTIALIDKQKDSYSYVPLF